MKTPTIDAHRVVGALPNVNGLTRAGPGRFLTAKMGGQQISLWDSRTSQKVGEFGTGSGVVSWYAARSSTGLVAAGFGDCTVRVWDPQTNETRELARLNGIVASLAWSADGALLFTGNCGDNTVRLWDVKRATVLAQGSTKKSGAWFVAMAGDASRGVSGAGDKLIHVWAPKTGGELAALPGHTGKILGLVCSADGRRAYSASQDKSVRAWDLEERRERFVLGGHTRQVTCVALAPDERQLASTSSDGTIRLWNAETGSAERVISLGVTQAAAIDYASDGAELFAGCSDGVIRAFEVTRQARDDRQSVEGLFEAVWADPEHDGPRAVLADYLSERGDPRGEFITLQLTRAAGTSTVESRTRERELLALHQREWVGPISPLIETTFVKFERGFVVSCALKALTEKGTPPPRHHAWATVKTFSASEKCPKSLIAHLLALGARRVPRAG
jgi:uncharacterized protein (TIGR02996 family)